MLILFKFEFCFSIKSLIFINPNKMKTYEPQERKTKNYLSR